MATREEAWELLCTHTSSERLRRHARAVEIAMRAYAERFGADAEEWGIVGLLHDLDYERHPSAEEHPFAGERILAEHGYPERIRRAVLSHADHTRVKRESNMERALYACDELCGFLLAVAYVRPDGKIAGVEPRSVRKKMKDKAFARAVSREELLRGAEELGVEFDEHVRFLVAALAAHADELGV
ncbi:MAG: HDIG domain-containing protein [Bacteroidota bacterium]|nr:HDIG domain-containing protein [Bacteroidota bacterium]